MGCVQSQSDVPRKERYGKAGTASPASGATEEKEAARLLSQQDKSAAAEAAAPPQPGPERRDTAVLKQAGAFDQLHAEAHRPPELKQVEVKVGKRSSVLLEGFEQKEAAARAMPELVNVDNKDLKQSKLYEKLREYEAKDAKAAAEPKLEKTFMQREREGTTGTTPAAASS